MSRTLRFQHVVAASVACWLLAGCFSSSSNNPNSNGTAEVPRAAVENPEGDPSVSAEDGGPGFTGEGWTTVKPSPLGDPRAVKGGTMRTSTTGWPENLRIYGTGANTFLNSIVESLCYESMLQIDEHTQQFVPKLATHWKISDDQMTFTFRIDPRAHWSDGKPVTTVDVIATYRLIDDETLIDPINHESIVAKMKEPVAKSKYIFEVTCKEKHWRNFISLSAMAILPAHQITTITAKDEESGKEVERKFTGKDYLDNYNFSFTATSGPYIVHPVDIKENESLTLTRRDDYWAADDERNKGLYNIDKIRFAVIRDQRLAFDKARKGDLDFYVIYTAKWWVEDLADDLEAIEKGHLIRQKIFTKYPQGFQGLAFNMRKPPLNDLRVRNAIALLFDRKTMLDKFAYNEYHSLKSYFPGGAAENTDNELVEYKPREAAKLLAEAGWKDRGSDGILVKDGKKLSFSLSYNTQGLEKYFTTLKEDCKKVGVEFNLSLTTRATQWKNTQERNFEIASQNWGAALFPSPEQMWHSKMAGKEGSVNITGFKDEEADKLIDAYNAEFDLTKRTQMLRQIDAIVFRQHSYALAWYLPCQRILYLNKFGMPKTVLPKYADWRSVFAVWWVDPSKAQTLKAARKSGNSIKPIPPVELRPWENDDEKTVKLK